MISQGYDEWKKAPPVDKTITCPHCGEEHLVKNSRDVETDIENSVIQFYKCGDKLYLAGIKGKKV